MTSRDDVTATLAAVTASLPGGGEERPGQQQMALAVAEAIAHRRHLVVQAGTGTGKSLAYLVPALAAGHPVVVATATKALQEQLVAKDVPAIEAALGRRVPVAILKGRSNYLCLAATAEVGGGVQQDLSGEGAGLVDQVRRLLAWSATTESGDREDLGWEPHPRAWAMVSVGPRECPGAQRCPFGQPCFTERARAAAAAADVVVVNTHLYGAHVASGGTVLPPHETVVFDEAHQLEEVMTQSLGVEVAPGRLGALHTMARLEGAPAVGELAEPLRRLLGERVGRQVAGDAELDAALGVARSRVEALAGALLSAPPGDDDRGARARTAAGHLAADLARVTSPGEGEVLWVDGTARQPVLRLSPIDVGPPLAPLWGSVTAVLTSATIPPGLARRVGLGQVRELDVGSPFDYRTQSLLYVARHLPDRRDPASEPALHDELAALITAAGGRTLALFTSRRATDAAAEALVPRLPFRLLVQGELPKRALLEAFAADETSCLFATVGMWQGVDVPGRALSLVTVDRLPFGRPDDPLLDARRRRAGDAAFSVVDLPRAATLLAQGVGRLIRSRNDWGVVAVLDRRLAVAGYRRALLDALPPMRRTVERADVEAFFARALAPATAPAGRARPDAAATPSPPARAARGTPRAAARGAPRSRRP